MGSANVIPAPFLHVDRAGLATWQVAEQNAARLSLANVSSTSGDVFHSDFSATDKDSYFSWGVDAAGWHTPSDAFLSATTPALSPGLTPAPALPTDATPHPRAIGFLCRILPKRIKLEIGKVLTGPELPKNKIADAVAIGVLGGFSPVPFTNFLAAGALAAVCKRNAPIAILATLYNNALTVAPILWVEWKLGALIFPESRVAAVAAGTVLLAATVPIAARLLTLLFYDRLRDPLTHLLQQLAETPPPTT